MKCTFSLFRRMKGNPNHRFVIYMRMQNETLDRRLMKGN
jgi:hypothetical protein